MDKKVNTLLTMYWCDSHGWITSTYIKLDDDGHPICPVGGEACSRHEYNVDDMFEESKPEARKL